MDLEHPTKITLITSDTIARIHLTCRLLNHEASPFLKSKVTEISSLWQAPRIILHAGLIEHLFEWEDFVDELLRMIDVVRDNMGQDSLNESRQRLLVGRDLLYEKDLDVVQAFAERAGKYIRDSGISSHNWWYEAKCIYDGDHPDREDYLKWSGQSNRYLAEVEERARKLRDEAERGMLQVAVVLENEKGGEEDVPRFVSGLADCCMVHQVRTSLRTFGWRESEDVTMKTDVEHVTTETAVWIRFDGEMEGRLGTRSGLDHANERHIHSGEKAHGFDKRPRRA